MASILPPAAQALNDVASLLRQVLETEAVEPPESQPV